MKFSLLLLLGLSLPYSISAQVVTGGAIMGPQLAILAASENIKSFEQHLVQKHKWCPSAGIIKLKKADLMDSYLKLALLRATHATGDDCDAANAYLKCMNDEMTVSKLNKLKGNPIATSFLMAKYNISKVRVNQILNFFSKLDKKIE